MATRAASRSEEFLTKKVNYRGTEYTVRELSIAEFDEIIEKSTQKRTITDAGGNETIVEDVDNRIQQRLMVSACVTPRVKAAELGVRLYGGLWRAVQELHFEREPDLAVPKPEEEDEEDKPGE